MTQKPTSIQSGQSGRDAVEYDLREIDRASACGAVVVATPMRSSSGTDSDGYPKFEFRVLKCT